MGLCADALARAAKGGGGGTAAARLQLERGQIELGRPRCRIDSDRQLEFRARGVGTAESLVSLPKRDPAQHLNVRASHAKQPPDLRSNIAMPNCDASSLIVHAGLQKRAPRAGLFRGA